VKKLIAAGVTLVAVLGTSAAFGGQSERVPGESLDSGLGALSASYTAEEFMQRPAGYVAGEKQDSGLGSVTKEELARIISAYSQPR
jgi:hypothetical protein